MSETKSSSKKADEDSAASDGNQDPNACTPCRGTGSVISNLGGEPKQVVCPWCEGSGQRSAAPS